MSHKLNFHITMAKLKNHFPSTATAAATTNCQQSRTALHLIWNDWEKKIKHTSMSACLCTQNVVVC